MKLNDEIKQQLRQLIQAHRAENQQQEHRFWVEDFFDEVPEDVNALIDAIDECDQDEVTDYLHELIGAIN